MSTALDALRAKLNNIRHIQFADAYVNGDNKGNATACYMEIYGCSYAAAKTNGNELLTNADIKAYIDALIAENSEYRARKEQESIDKEILTEEMVKRKVRDLMFGAENESVQKGATELAAKILGMLTDKLEVKQNIDFADVMKAARKRAGEDG